MIRGTVSANGPSGVLRLARGEALRLTLFVAAAQTFLGTLVLQQSTSLQGAWQTARDVDGAVVVFTGPITGAGFTWLAGAAILPRVDHVTFVRLVASNYGQDPITWRLSEVLDPDVPTRMLRRRFDASNYHPGAYALDPTFGAWTVQEADVLTETFAIGASRRLQFDVLIILTEATNLGTGLAIELPGGLVAADDARNACVVQRAGVYEMGFVDAVAGESEVVVSHLAGGTFPNGAQATGCQFQIAVFVDVAAAAPEMV